jgi:hypothetical protein
VCCFVLLLGFFGPRLAFAFWWIFGNKVDAAFSTWAWPLLGLIFAPWTSICYVLAWGPIGGVSGAGWLLVALGVVLDLVSYTARSARARFGEA